MQPRPQISSRYANRVSNMPRPRRQRERQKAIRLD